MEKLWLSGKEKKYYSKVYCKLVESANKTQAKDLKKLTITRAGIENDNAAIIIQKSFDQSNDKKHIDQTGFFYLMKYIAYLQNGGNPNDDITKIQNELPNPSLPSGNKDKNISTNESISLLQQNNYESSLGVQFESSNNETIVDNAEQKNEEESKEIQEENKQNIQGDDDLKNDENKNEEQKKMDKVAQILMTSDGYQIEEYINSSGVRNDVSLIRGEDISVIRGEDIQDTKIEEVSREKEQITQNIQEIVEATEAEENHGNDFPPAIQQNINLLQESEKFSLNDSEIQELQSTIQAAVKVDIEGNGKEEFKQEQQDHDQQIQYPVNDEQMYLINLEETYDRQKEQNQRSVVPQFINERMPTFGPNSSETYAIKQMVQEVNHQVQYANDMFGNNYDYDYDNGFGFRNERRFTFAQGPVEQIGMTPQAVSNLKEQKGLGIVEELNEENSKIKNGNLERSQETFYQDNWGGVSKIGMDGISQLSFGEDGQSRFIDCRNSGQTNYTNPNMSRVVFGNQEESRLYCPNEEGTIKQLEYVVGDHVKNGFNASALKNINQFGQEEHIDQQIYEAPRTNQKYPVLPQRGQQNNNISQPQKNGFNGENKYQGQKNVDEEDDDNDDQQLMKSVMDCNEFSKVDQNQIKIALDMLKLNREGSQLQKSRTWKEKAVKRVKIERWREACDSIFMKKHVLYEIHTQSDKGQLFTVDRRYNHFRALHNYFENSVDYFGIIKPQLPSSNKTNIGSYLGSTMMDQATLEQRKIDLENYLNLYLSNEILRQDKILSQFLEEKEFIPPEEKPFSYLEWMKNLAANAYNTDLAEMKEYAEAVLKTNMQEFFKQSESEIDTREIDEKMEKVKSLGMQVSRLVDFLSEDIRSDTEQRLSIDQLEEKFYTEADQREDQMAQQANKSGIQESLKKFKAEIFDLKDKINQRIDSKVLVLQQFRFIHSLIESAKVAQQVLKRKITDRIILKKIKISKVNKLQEQNNSNSDATEAERKLRTVNAQYKQSEEIIKIIQDKLTKELGSFIKIQQNNIAEAMTAFITMQKESLMIFAQINSNQMQLFS